jgi:hypothetical protein
VSFGSIQNLSKNSGTSTAPVVATVGNFVYVAWEDTSNGGRQTFMRTSTNDGVSWGATQSCSLPGNADPDLSAVQIATAGSNVYLTWDQGGAAGFAFSTNNGASYTCKIISGGAPAGTDTGEALAASVDTVYVAWAAKETSGNGEIIETSSTNSGATFSTPITISTGASGGPTNTHTDEDEVAASGSYVYVVWDSIWFSSCHNSCASIGSWSTPQQLHPAACIYPCLSREPMISATGSDVYVTYPSDVSGPYQTYIVVSNNNGQTFGLPQLLSGGLSNTREVQVTSNGNDVFVTSRGTKSGVSGTQQYVYVSTDSGSSFAAPILLGSLPGAENGFGGFALDSSNGNVFVQWPHNTPSQVYISESTNTGSTWSAPQQVSSSTAGVVAMGDPGGSQGPLAAAGGGHVYVVWEDTSTGNGDIYFVAGT